MSRHLVTSKSQILVIVLSMLLSSIVTLGGVHGDYPVRADNDENYYIGQSLQMAALNEFDPPMSCNPASTLIYPLVFYYWLVDRFVYQDKKVLPNSERMELDFPFQFVLVPRMADAVLTAFVIPFLFLLCRRLFSARAAGCAVVLFALQPLVMETGQIVRSDNVALFFEVLTLFFAFRLLDDEGRRNRIGAGISFGLAVASRYFMLALLPFIFLIELILFVRRKAPLRRILEVSYSAALGILVFLFTTPYLILDFAHYKNDLYLELITPCLGVDNLSPIGNANFYWTDTFQYYFGETLLWLIAVGLVAALLKRDYRQYLLIFLLVIFFVGTCSNRRHWHRWMLPLVPILVMYVGWAIDCLLRVVALVVRLALAPLRLPVRLAWRKVEPYALNFFALITVCYLSAPGAEAIIRFDLAKNTYATDVEMYYWFKENIPKDTPFCMVGIWEWPDRERWKIMDYMWGPEYFDTVNKGVYYTVPQLWAKGYRLFVVRDLQVYLCREAPDKFPRELAFFKYLDEHAKKLKEIAPVELKTFPGGPHTMQRGSVITIYQMPDVLPKDDAGQLVPPKGESNKP